MRFFSRNIMIIIGALGALSVASMLFQNQVVGYILFALAILIPVAQLFRVRQQMKAITTKYLSNEKAEDTDPLSGVSSLLEKRQEQLTNIISAVKKIQEGNLDQETIGHLEGEAKAAITNLQSNLLSMREQEEKQNWIVKGIAKMGEIRKSNSSLEDYAYQITSTLVKYLEANQGAFYMLIQEEGVLQLLASYAYGKRKFTDGKVTVDVGSGLLGQSIIEKDLIFMTQVPANYVKITSGLGEATPRCIVITPLIFRDHVYGAIEMASFQVLQKHHLELIREISESVASELADIIRQENTAQLLKQSQEQAYELKQQEEELRQNMEEMQATQEEMKRKEKSLLTHMTDLNKAQDQMKMQEDELKQQLRQVLAERKKNQAILEGCVDGVISFAENGKIQFCNKAAEEIFGGVRRDILFKPVGSLLELNIMPNKTLQTKSGTPIGIRTEVSAKDKTGESISVLLTETKYVSDEGVLFTLFIQKISVDLF
jgi:PAS domain S-box-containing protein